VNIAVVLVGDGFQFQRYLNHCLLYFQLPPHVRDVNAFSLGEQSVYLHQDKTSPSPLVLNLCPVNQMNDAIAS
jgi:hypothetical protein